MNGVAGKAFDVVIRGGTIVAEGAPYRADIGISNGVIIAIGLPHAGQETVGRVITRVYGEDATLVGSKSGKRTELHAN